MKMDMFSDLPDYLDDNEDKTRENHAPLNVKAKKPKRKNKQEDCKGSKLQYIDKKPSFSLESIVSNSLRELKKRDPDLCEKFTLRPKFDIPTDEVKIKEEEISKKERKRERVEKRNQEKLQDDIEKQIFEEAPDVPPGMTFMDMHLSPQIMQALETMGYSNPTPIQATTISVALQGRDICGCAATGTGKTLAFMLPVIERLIHRPKDDIVTRVLVMVPTRELGIQVYEVSNALARYTDIKISIAVGGLNIETQEDELTGKPDIIIATPGRLIAHIYKTKSFTLKDLEILILDEADRMLDDNFSDQLREIVRQCVMPHQTMLFSATMTEQVKELALVSLDRPIRVFVNNNTQVAQNLRQEFIRLRCEDDRLPILCYLVSHVFTERTMVFVRQRTECHYLHIIFCVLGLKCGELHGGKKQVERLEALEGFRNRKFNLLVTTDVAARGLDIQGVDSVINYRMPGTYKQYVHRVGRTARAGESGCSVSIYCDSSWDYTVHRSIKKHSLTALHERVISKDKIKAYKEKLSDMEDFVEEVKKQFSLLQKEDDALNKARKKEKLTKKKEGYQSVEFFEKQEQVKNEQKGKKAEVDMGKIMNWKNKDMKRKAPDHPSKDSKTRNFNKSDSFKDKMKNNRSHKNKIKPYMRANNKSKS